MVTPKYNKLCSKEVLIMKDNNKDKIKILVVEDTQVFAKTLKNILEKEGYQVIVAKNGIEGINLLKNNLFNLIISDIEMPEMDGLTFIKNVRNIDEAKNIPAIALTSLNDEQDRQRGFEAGFDYYEIKLNEKELIDIVNAILAKVRSVV